MKCSDVFKHIFPALISERTQFKRCHNSVEIWDRNDFPYQTEVKTAWKCPWR